MHVCRQNIYLDTKNKREINKQINKHTKNRNENEIQ